jgi:mono/diheme cytochrome c family protein
MKHGGLTPRRSLKQRAADMAATDKHYRDQKVLNLLFAYSCVAMLLSVIWMLVDDYRREYKQVQREFRDVEESVSLNIMLDKLPNPQVLEDAGTLVAEKRKALDAKKQELDSTIRQLNVEREKLSNRFQTAKTLVDSRSSYRDQDAEHVGEARTEEQRAAARKHVEERDELVARLRADRDQAQKDLDEKDAEYAAKITDVLRPYVDDLSRAEDYLKEIAGEFDRFAKLTAEKRWKAGDTFRNLPILDGFASPTRITQFVSDDLTIDYGGFKYVTRYDRCATCHLAIENSSYTRSDLLKVAEVRTVETAINELVEAIKAAEVKSARADSQLDQMKGKLNDQLSAVRSAIKEQKGLRKAVADVASTIRNPKGPNAEGLMEKASYENVNAALKRLEKSAERQDKLWTVHAMLARRKELGEKLSFHASDVPSTLRDVKLTGGQVTQFAAHPRLDLFVDGNSTHPMEKFGCTICHAGQGSATDFQHADHMPNDAVQRKTWQAGGTDGHHWEADHNWEFPMFPKRFVEASCVKCHHQITDLIRMGTKEEAPKLLEGYRLVKENGCFGCHEISGDKAGRPIGPDLRVEPTPALEWLPIKDQLAAKADTLNPPGTLRKVGPSLRRLSEKVPNPDDKNVNAWLLSWIKNPRGFRPDTKMPHFYGQSTNNEEFLKKQYEELSKAAEKGEVKDQSRYPDAELYSIAYYLQSESAKALAGEDTTRYAVRQDLLAKATQFQSALLTVQKLSAKAQPTFADRTTLSEKSRERDRLKKDLDGLRRRYRDLSLMSRPLDVVFINAMGDQLQDDLDRALEPGLSEDEIKATFDRFASVLKDMQTRTVPVAVLATKKELIDSTGKEVPWSTVPEKPAGSGKDLFTQKGCLACHSRTDTVIPVVVSPDEKFDETSDANFGPELSRIGDKLGSDKKNGRSWLIQWILNPNVYHPRTKMPITHLTVDEAAAIADWLLASGDNWKPQSVTTPEKKTLQELAMMSMVKVAFIGRQKAADALKKGLPKADRERLPPDADEQLLIEGGNEGEIGEKQLMRYIGKKAISRQGCFGCHDIPGFESAKPIGTGLNDWGKKDPARLAFEDANAFVKEHFAIAETRDDMSEPNSPRPSSAWVSAASNKSPAIEEFYVNALIGRQREGFLHLKLAEPRSYDFGRVREWDDRLRMPQFKFARTHRRGKEGSVEKIDEYKARRVRESKGEYDAKSQFAEARAREAVMTFVLGLIAEPIPLKFVNTPKTDRLAEVKGRKVLEKFNCAGCHEIRPGVYEFKLPEDKKSNFVSEQLDTGLAPGDHHFQDSTAWVGRPSPIHGGFLAYGVSADDRPPFRKNRDGEPVYSIRLSEALRFTDSKGAIQNKPASESIEIPAEAMLANSSTFGGDFARLIGPYLAKLNAQTFGGRGDQRNALPPPLLREGERVQPQWLFKFLLDPFKVRPLTVLRMPKFNMSEDEARALVEYFAAVDKLNNPNLGLNEAFAEIPQKDWSYWQKKNTLYLASKEPRMLKHLDEEKETLPVVWQRVLEEQIGEKLREVEGMRSLLGELEKAVDKARDDLKAAETAEEKAKQAVKDAKKDEEEKAKEALKAASEAVTVAKGKVPAASNALKTMKDNLDKRKKEADDLKDEITRGSKAAGFQAFLTRWQKEYVFAGDAYRLLTDSQSVCISCHSVGTVPGKEERGPNLGLASERLRPRWTEQWIANPKRLFTYDTIMPQNFARNEKPSPVFLIGTPREHVEASRDVLMNLPTIANLDVNRYRLAPKGGK